MADDDLVQYPEPTNTDDVQLAAKAAISAVPILGGPLGVLFDRVIEPSIDKRREAWGREVTTLLSELAEHQITPDDLAGREEWISAMGRATRAAANTHSQEKLEMLRRVLATMALDTEASSVVGDRFIRYIDDLDAEHFLVLQFIDDPVGSIVELGLDAKGPIKEWILDPGRREGPATQNVGREVSLDLFAASKGLDEISTRVVHSDLEQVGLVDMSIDMDAELYSGYGKEHPNIRPWTTSIGELLLKWVVDG